MSTQIRISAKKLGGVAMPNFCPRCFWILKHMDGDPPFQTFPSIFSTIDGYTKRVVHGYFDSMKKVPPYLKELKINGYIEPPHHSKFSVVTESQVLLSGSPDAVFTRSDGSIVIADYKTARYQGKEDPLFPMYEVQLNVYAMLAAKVSLGRVSSLVLVYTAPLTGIEAAEDTANHRETGFAMGFKVDLLEVAINAKLLSPLLDSARRIYDLRLCPEGRIGCKDCRQLDGLADTRFKNTNPYLKI